MSPDISCLPQQRRIRRAIWVQLASGLVDRLNNPAGRLLALVEEARRVGKPDQAGREVWRAVLHAEEDDALYLRRFGIVMALPDEIRAAVESLDVNQELHLRGLPNIEQALAGCGRRAA